MSTERESDEADPVLRLVLQFNDDHGYRLCIEDRWALVAVIRDFSARQAEQAASAMRKDASDYVMSFVPQANERDLAPLAAAIASIAKGVAALPLPSGPAPKLNFKAMEDNALVQSASRKPPWRGTRASHSSFGLEEKARH